MALIKSCLSSPVAMRGAVGFIAKYTTGSRQVAIAITDLANNSVQSNVEIYTGTTPVTNGNYSIVSNGSTDITLTTATACEVYKNGSSLGTTTANVAFSLGVNPSDYDASQTVFNIIPV